MKQLVIVLMVGVAIGAAGMRLAAQPAKAKGGFIVQHDADIAKNEPGGLHEQHEDEVYYVLSGKGVMTVDDTKVDMTPGTAVLTRPGSSHSLKQIGSEDLVVLISYEIK